MKNVKTFKENFQKSVTIRLMLPNLKSQNLTLGKKSGYQASIAYCAWHDDNLNRLEYLFNKFNIIENGTTAFKNRLNEKKWLESKKTRRRDVALNTIAAISELVVADYLSVNGKLLLGLSAISEGFPDVTYLDKTETYHCEIKYFEDAPELHNSRIRAAKFGHDIINPPGRNQTLNYIFSRIAEAVIQLQRYKIKCRSIFLVFHELAVLHSRSTLENNLDCFTSWYQDTKCNFPAVLGKNAHNILRKRPHEWLNKINTLTIGTMSNYKLENVVEYKFSSS